jgi:HD superfamily phosphodiesterase
MQETTQEQMQSISDRWNLLSEFVKEICKGRDDSHGHMHMEAVAKTAKYIAEKEYSTIQNYNTFLLDVITVAWLHDVSDHKYDHNGLLEEKLDEFGYKNFTNFREYKQVIQLISYSYENNQILCGAPIDYENILGIYYANIRHIVSDADKLEAIGSVGIERCIKYIQHLNPCFTKGEINQAVYFHANEKLLRLKDEFIRTQTGKQLAIPLHQQMLDIISKM